MYDQTTATRDKARRLVARDAVHRVDDADTYVVAGDHGTYLVTLVDLTVPGGAYCTCPATIVDCSHVRAARTVRAKARIAKLNAEVGTSPFEGLDR